MRGTRGFYGMSREWNAASTEAVVPANAGTHNHRISCLRKTFLVSEKGSNARLSVPAAFQIGRAYFLAWQKIGSGSAQRDQAVDHDVTAMGELERMIGVLFDDQHGEAILPV